MINPATQDRTEFNTFTQFVYDDIFAEHNLKVRLRNGEVIKVKWFDGDGPDYEHFTDIKHRCWENNGRSITSMAWDMMEIV